MRAFIPISTTKPPPSSNHSLIFIGRSKFRPNFVNSNSLKFCCFAAKSKQKSDAVKKQPPPKTEKKNSKPSDVSQSSSQSLQLPKPPAGFVVDDQGRVLMVSNKRIATIVDSANNLALECVIRRVFRSSKGEECMLLCPVDTPIQMLKSTSFCDWLPVSDEEAEAVLPAAAYALAKIHMHLVHSGFSYTARGGFSYAEEDIFEYVIAYYTIYFAHDKLLRNVNRGDIAQKKRPYADDDVEGSSTNEGVEITCFHSDGTNYMIYTPADPILFVAVKDKDGELQIADNDLMKDHRIISAVDEETEFNAFVEEEAALIESLLEQG